MTNSCDALIIGAGPAGSTVATLLARAGWKVMLVERENFPRTKVCGECIAAPNLPLLDHLGLGLTFHALAGPSIKQVAVISGQHDIRAPLPPLEHTARPWGRALRREHLDWLLLQQAEKSGAIVYQPWTMQSFSGEAGNWLCRLRASGSTATQEIQASLLIAAHGSWHRPHSQEHRPSDLLAFKTQFTSSRLEPGVLPVLAFPGGYGGMVVSDAGMTTVACCIRRDRLAACRAQAPQRPAGEAMEAYLKTSCKGVRDVLEGAERSSPWLAAGPIRPGCHLNKAPQDVFVIGNAAGEAHPIIGEGISMAIQSAWLLASHLLEKEKTTLSRDEQRTVRRNYALRWRYLFTNRLSLSAAFAHLAMHPPLTSALLPLLHYQPEMLTHAARWCGKVSKPPPGNRLSPASG